ncbi:MAG TPA: glycosyl hydrolase [Candidatus Sulfotelmatobacter sp.]|nr:glycosyl hydrolase [Candidatus Sulfotelmatobacter sp.]
MLRRACWLLLLTSLLLPSKAVATDDPPSQGSLYTEFLNPPREYSPMPFWFWNGELEGKKIQEQIRQMVDQHVYGAFLHARDGLKTPYLSEEWWKAIDAGLQEAKRSGFFFNFVDEYDWPSGEVRNIWMKDNHQSEVLKRNPNFRIKSLAYKEQIVHGPVPVTLANVPEQQAILVARWMGGGRLDRDSLRRIDLEKTSAAAHWDAPAGDWLVMQFYLEPATGFDGGVVDLMNPDAMKLYFDLSYGEYYRRFAPYFGNTIRYSFSDHEGVFGYRIAWTPALYETFQQRTGYDLRNVLPLLVYDGGSVSRKTRQDYLATVTQLYQNSYWSGITQQAKALGIGRSGHAWEESLQSATAFEGSLFALERGLDPVGVDSLYDFGRQALNFKVAQSVADFEGRRFACENQGVQGTDSYLDMQGLRKATNAIGAWGVNLFIPHAFDYDAGRANYPPDWLHQPYWPYFSNYADYVRRISFMNSEKSRHAVNVLLYYPITSVWADSDPVFSSKSEYQHLIDPAFWKNGTVLINDYYGRMILRLAERQWDYNIADDFYFEKARVEGNELVIGPQRFRAVVLPAITTISSKTLRKLLEFYAAGGTVLAIRQLPYADGDVTQDGIDELFGAGAVSTPRPFTESHNSAGGKSFYVAEDVETLIGLLDTHVPKDVKVVSSSPENLFFQHRSRDGQDYYWLVNDSRQTRSTRFVFSTTGIPEKWDALTGERSPLFYVNRPEGTEVLLNFDPWDAYYIVFRPLHGPPQQAELVSTNAETLRPISHTNDSLVVRATAPADGQNLEVLLRANGKDIHTSVALASLKPLTLDGPWDFRPQPDQVPVPYARVKDAREGEGDRLGFGRKELDDSAWPSLWLSESQNTIRNWEIIGPFPNEDDGGYEKADPPETEYQPQSSYVGNGQALVKWQRYFGDEPYLSGALIWLETSGGRFDDDSPVVDLTRGFRLTDAAWTVGYAHSYLYSPEEQTATFVVASDNWAKVWVNHKPAFGQLRHPFWYELNDNWADRFQVTLQKGWNEVLVKVGVGRYGALGFTFRVADGQGRTIPNLISSLARYAPESASSPVETRWYRVEVPPGTSALVPPALSQPYRLFFNGHEIKQTGAASVSFKNLLQPGKNVLVIAATKDDRLTSPLLFVSESTAFELQSWTKTGLAQFSGTAIYEKTFSLPANFNEGRVLLDLGKVSSVAKVQINGRDAGTLVWSPYRLDVTSLLKPGENQLRIWVTNTEANARAVGASHKILSKIDLCGMEGPVSLIPYVEKTLTLGPD